MGVATPRTVWVLERGRSGRECQLPGAVEDLDEFLGVHRGHQDVVVGPVHVDDLDVCDRWEEGLAGVDAVDALSAALPVHAAGGGQGLVPGGAVGVDGMPGDVFQARGPQDLVGITVRDTASMGVQHAAVGDVLLVIDLVPVRQLDVIQTWFGIGVPVSAADQVHRCLPPVAIVGA